MHTLTQTRGADLQAAFRHADASVGAFPTSYGSAFGRAVAQPTGRLNPRHLVSTRTDASLLTARATTSSMVEQEPQIFHDPVSALAQYGMDFLRMIPGRDIIMRYIASSYQDDPIRSLLELALLIFAVRTILQNRTRSGQNTSNFVQLEEKVGGVAHARTSTIWSRNSTPSRCVSR